uniref:Zinc transporter ZIP11 n=1 Tax=Acrobeloides nanus TaxID=290746 RepID=A0A914EPS0_9BILA
MIPDYDPVIQALLASLFTWGVTALGAALVFVLPSNSKKFLDVSLGFAAGVMTAASFWSLLAPAIEISEEKMGSFAFIPVAIGFALGALFVHLSDRMIPSCVVAEISIIKAITHETGPVASSNRRSTNEKNMRLKDSSSKQQMVDPESEMVEMSLKDSMSDQLSKDNTVENGRLTVIESSVKETSCTSSDTDAAMALSWRRILLLIMAVTVHNIPEGAAVGVGFGSVGKTPAATFEKAFNLAVGIGLQNFPEGLAVSLPLAGFGYSKWKSFFYGQMSGMVEPLAALLGAAAVIMMEPVLPYALSFAAGAMIYVVFDDIVPEAQRNGNGKSASVAAIAGFLVMMSMDVGLG